MIGIFLFLLSFFSSIAVVWYQQSFIIIAISVCLAVIFAFRFRHVVKPGQILEAEISHFWRIKKNFIFPVLFFILAALACVFLILTKSNGILLTPWQTISHWYLPVFFSLTLILSVMLCSEYRTKTLLIFIIFFSFIQHLYLPLSHELPWGGDVWRHIAVEEKLTRGDFYPPVLFGPEVKYRPVSIPFFGNVSIPEVFLIPQKYSYGQLWGVVSLIAKISGLSLATINIWLLPVVWSIAMPILLFRIGSVFFRSYRYGLWLSFAAAMPFPWQALGALTLPVSLGYVTFFYVFALWLDYVHTNKSSLRNLSLVFAGLMIFGYPLHFLLIWFLILATYIIRFVQKIKSELAKKSLAAIGFFSSLFVIPVLELVTKISFVPEYFDLFANLKRLFGQFSGWYFARNILPFDTLSGNIFFNHTPLSAFVPSIFLDWRWWVIPVMIFLWGLVIYGLSRVVIYRVSVFELLLAIFALMVFGGYLIGWFVLDGDRLFTRRLDAMVAFVAVIWAIYGIKELLKKARLDSISYFLRPLGIVFVTIVFSWFATATYASGPDMRVVSKDEYNSAIFVWGNMDKKADNNCVLADTWTLLPLEAISAGRIVGGGFPIDYQFAQPERVVLFSELIRNPRVSIFEIAKQKTGASQCAVIYNESSISKDQSSVLDNFFPKKSVIFGDQKVFFYEK
ncbi:MAG: hypothetical protein KBD73_02370 [Candidatus Magasanikbacteria bacterium]|nr:hypothetical protein [Candidatus Magasanikbacteria bacterium]